MHMVEVMGFFPKSKSKFSNLRSMTTQRHANMRNKNLELDCP